MTLLAHFYWTILKMYWMNSWLKKIMYDMNLKGMLSWLTKIICWFSSIATILVFGFLDVKLCNF